MEICQQLDAASAEILVHQSFQSDVSFKTNLG